MLVAHFVTGSNIATTSMIWCDSLCKRGEETLPRKHQHGGAIHVGVSHTGNEVGRSRPECAEDSRPDSLEDPRIPRP